jgi:hypothetical protein
LTHLNNLPSLLAEGYLLSTTDLTLRGRSPISLAFNSIQAQRAARIVPCGPGGSMHDYVPFYFTRRSPMLYTISKGNVECEGGQENIVHIVSTVQKVIEANLSFVFTDGHGIIRLTEFYDDPKFLSEIDWTVINGRYWFDTPEDGDRKRRKQAEFLTHRGFPWNRVIGIVTMTDQKRLAVEELLLRTEHRPQVVVRRNWYY